MACNSIKKDINKVCIADLDKRISIKSTSISANNSPNSNAGVAFTEIAGAWALIKTSTNNKYINGVNTITSQNTEFYIRYNSAIDFDQKLYIEYNSRIFEVTGYENINKDNMFIKITTIEKGASSISANLR